MHAKQNAPPFDKFSHFSQFSELKHHVFSRVGGISPAPFDTLNVAFGVGDAPENVRRNRAMLKAAAGGGHPVFIHQVHGAAVVTLRNGDAPASGPLEGDALVTDIPGLMLVIQVADCQPVMLYDPCRRVVANIHAGWRGSVVNVIAETVRAMSDLGCDPRDMFAGIGPSLGPCCAEFVNFRDEIPSAFWGYRMEGDRFDFWRISTDQLVSAGIPESRIENMGICTRCRSNRYFSYRRDKRTGRFATMIGLSDRCRT